jgi:rhodanese-related sulfurtransferase
MTQIRSTNSPNAPGVKDVEPKDLWEARSQVAIVDVRRPDEWEGELGHIPGATLIVLDTLPQQVDAIPKDKPVVVVCRSGGRSTNATSFLLGQGFTNVYNMRGGMLLWNELGLQTEGKAK